MNGKVYRLVKVLGTNPDDMNGIPGTHVVGGENRL